jgi:hypothetical protein
MRKLFWILAAALLFGCGGQETRPLSSMGGKSESASDYFKKEIMERLTSADRAELAAAYAAFIQAAQTSNYEGINAYVHPRCGIYKILAPGAMAFWTNASQLSPQFMQELVLSTNPSQQAPEVQFGDQPYYECEAPWEEGQPYPSSPPAGVFGYAEPGFDQLTGLARAAMRYESMQFTDQQLGQALRCEMGVTMTIRNTADYHDLHFSKLDGKWYLIAADLSTPCDA